MNRIERFDPPAEVKDIGIGIDLQVTSARIDDGGVLKVNFELWNGTKQHADSVLVRQDVDRERCVKAAKRKCDAVDTAKLGTALLNLPNVLPSTLEDQRRRKAASPEDLEGPDIGSTWPYEVRNVGIVRLSKTDDGSASAIPLTNFSARIVDDVAIDDGAEVRRSFRIEATLRGRPATFDVPSDRFASMTWPTEYLGAGAILYPGQGTRDHARVAIQVLSGDVPQRRVYGHTGWRKVDDGWLYLHGDGAIGADGSASGVDVAIPPGLARYSLPNPPDGKALVDAIRSELKLLTLSRDAVDFPLVALPYRAVLRASDFSIHLTGPTGAGKSERAALVQQHFGPLMDARHLPAGWESTANALEALAFAAKDAVLTVDDFAPAGTVADVQRMHRDADRLLRAQGNNSGRTRLRADASLKVAKSPRGTVLCTGEDTPRGQSLRARILVLETGPLDLSWSILSDCQIDAGRGLYAQALAGYIRWLAPRYERIQDQFRSKLGRLRALASKSARHRRTPEIVANLLLGLHYFLRFARSTGALSPAEARAIWHRGWVAFGLAADAQAKHQVANDPTYRFVELLSAAIASGTAHVANANGDKPPVAKAWGWRAVPTGFGDFERTDWRPLGVRIGWVDDDNLYLDPETSYAVVQRLARDGGDHIAVSSQTLRKRLHERGLLASVDDARETLTVRRSLEGSQKTVLHFSTATLSMQEKPDIPDKPDVQATQVSGSADPDVGISASDHESTEKPDIEKARSYGDFSPIVGNVGFSSDSGGAAGEIKDGQVQLSGLSVSGFPQGVPDNDPDIEDGAIE